MSEEAIQQLESVLTDKLRELHRDVGHALDALEEIKKELRRVKGDVDDVKKRVQRL